MNKHLYITKQILAKQLKQLRKEKNMSLEDLSQHLMINHRWLTRLENAKANIEWYYIIKIAKFYKKEVKILLD